MQPSCPRGKGDEGACREETRAKARKRKEEGRRDGGKSANLSLDSKSKSSGGS